MVSPSSPVPFIQLPLVPAWPLCRPRFTVVSFSPLARHPADVLANTSTLSYSCHASPVSQSLSQPLTPSPSLSLALSFFSFSLNDAGVSPSYILLMVVVAFPFIQSTCFNFISPIDNRIFMALFFPGRHLLHFVITGMKIRSEVTRVNEIIRTRWPRGGEGQMSLYIKLESLAAGNFMPLCSTCVVLHAVR